MSRRVDYAVSIAPAAARDLRRLPPGDAARTRGPLLALAFEARPYGAARIRGTDFWRLRVGTLRIICSIDDEAQSAVVVVVARRSESTYRRLRDE